MQMSAEQRDSLRAILRRVDEVRGLAERPGAADAADPGDPGHVLATLQELVQELERSHRRLIETNVQLVSLREVASSMVGTHDTADTTRLVTRYLCRAYGFDEGFLLLIDRERQTLQGSWTHRRGDREQSFTIELPLTGDSGTLAHALWFNRTIVHHSPRRHRPAHLPEGHPLQEVLDTLGSTVCAPLLRSHRVLAADPHEICGARCPLGDASILAPPAGAAAEAWAGERERRQQHCLRCEVLPLLGVIGMARRHDAPHLGASDVMLLESIALSVAPMVENARLYQDLRQSERFRNHVLHSMADALAAVNMRGEILTLNHTAAELLGAPEPEVLGQPFGALFGESADAILRETLEHGREAHRIETVLRARDGTPVPVSLTTSLLRDDRRAIYGAIATFVDLTPLKRAEERARQLDRLAALGRFTSSVAHEIRNPLTGIGAGVQYLARSIPEGDPQHENLGFILNEIRRLDRIVQDLFSVTHPRRMDLRVAPIEETVKRAILCVEALFEQKGVRWRFDVAPNPPPVLHDLDQVQQVFINLLKNAAEASEAGTTVVVKLHPVLPPATRRGRRGAGAAGEGRATAPDGLGGPIPAETRNAAGGHLVPAVAVHVEDQGSGMTAEILETLFEPFRTHKEGGTGLGLYVSHDIVKRHGGNLTVQSEPGRGTRFTVELPVESNGGNT
jgi:two-component system, NtrC family, nitrogen regulation sensor histidine kinase GlnL